MPRPRPQALEQRQACWPETAPATQARLGHPHQAADAAQGARPCFVQSRHRQQASRLRCGEPESRGHCASWLRHGASHRTAEENRASGPLRDHRTIPPIRDEYLRLTKRQPGSFLFGGRRGKERSLTTRQYARLVSTWTAMIGLDASLFGTHSLRRTKATLIYRKTANLRAVQLLLGHSKVESAFPALSHRRRSRLSRERDWFFVTLAFGHHGPSHPSSCASAIAATLTPPVHQDVSQAGVSRRVFYTDHAAPPRKQDRNTVASRPHTTPSARRCCSPTSCNPLHASQRCTAHYHHPAPPCAATTTHPNHSLLLATPHHPTQHPHPPTTPPPSPPPPPPPPPRARAAPAGPGTKASLLARNRPWSPSTSGLSGPDCRCSARCATLLCSTLRSTASFAAAMW